MRKTRGAGSNSGCGKESQRVKGGARRAATRGEFYDFIHLAGARGASDGDVNRLVRAAGRPRATKRDGYQTKNGRRWAMCERTASHREISRR